MARILRPEKPNKGSTRPKWRRGQGNRKTVAADQAAIAERKKRRLEVFELKAVYCASWANVAQRVGISQKQARKDYKRAVEEYGQETASAYKTKANARYEQQLAAAHRAMLALHPLVVRQGDEGPDLKAIARYTALLRTQALIVTQQAQMNGAFAPVVVEVAGTVDHTIGPSPSKARELIKNYFGSHVAVRDSVPPGADDAGGDSGGSTTH